MTRAPGARPSRRYATALLVALMPVLAAGCATVPAGPDDSPPAAAAIDVEALQAAIARFNERLTLMPRLTARGTVELRWTDQAGRQREEHQIDVNVKIDLPRRTAIEGEKLGRRFFWLGSDAERYWFFDLSSTPTSVAVGAHDDALVLQGSALPVRPLALLDLIGLTPLPADVPATAVTIDAARDAWVVTFEGAGGRRRVWLDRGGPRLLRSEMLDAAGTMAVAADLGRERTVEIATLPPAGRPRIPSLIDVIDAEGRFAIKLGLSGIAVATSPRDPIFDLNRLIDYLEPERTVDLSARAGR